MILFVNLTNQIIGFWGFGVLGFWGFGSLKKDFNEPKGKGKSYIQRGRENQFREADQTNSEKQIKPIQRGRHL